MNKRIYCIIFILCIGLVNAKLFSIDNTVQPTFMGCSITGCAMQGNIDMNGYIIYNVTFVNATFHEYDPIFTAENGTLWQAINDKLNITDQRYNDTLLIIDVNDSFYIELGNYYTKNQSDGLYYPLTNPAGYINSSYANNTYYPLTNPAGYINSTTANGTWVRVTGDTMTGPLNMSGNNISDVDILTVHNITGRSPIVIGSPMISDYNITAATFYGNINGQNGTIFGMTITNGTIQNMHVSDSAVFNTSLLPELNNTFSLGASPDKFWKSFYVVDLVANNITSPDISILYMQIQDLNASINNISLTPGPPGTNGTNGVNGTSVFMASIFNNGDGTYTWYFSDGFNYTTGNLTGPQGIAGINGTSFDVSGPYLYNNGSNVIFFNDTSIYVDIDYLYNYTNAINSSLFTLTTDVATINASIKQPTGPYLAYNNSTFWVNDTYLNGTINTIAKVKSLTYNISCTTIGGACTNISGIIDYEIVEIIVTPTTITNKYRFSMTEYPNTAYVIDTDRALHTGVWDIFKTYALNSSIEINITSAFINEVFNVQIKYLHNGV